jgi:hypothetical protein
MIAMFAVEDRSSFAYAKLTILFNNYKLDIKKIPIIFTTGINHTTKQRAIFDIKIAIFMLDKQSENKVG